MKASIAASTPVDTPEPAPTAAPSTLPEVPTVEQLSAFLGLNRTTVYEYIGKGQIPSRRVGSRILLHGPTILRWLAGEDVQNDNAPARRVPRAELFPGEEIDFSTPKRGRR